MPQRVGQTEVKKRLDWLLNYYHQRAAGWPRSSFWTLRDRLQPQRVNREEKRELCRRPDAPGRAPEQDEQERGVQTMQYDVYRVVAARSGDILP